MTNKPTDHEIDVFVQVCREKGMRELDVFQAVLTRWGQPAHSGEPLTHAQAKALVLKYGNDPLHLVLQVERHHGITGGQHVGNVD